MTIIETSLGVKVDPSRIALSSATPIIKSGAFYIFSIRVSSDDVREYSFTSRDRAYSMRKVLIAHLEKKIRHEERKSA